MLNEITPDVGKEEQKNNRPHCFYLWFVHNKPVCSEEVQCRPCAYPFWSCPARIKNFDAPHENYQAGKITIGSSVTEHYNEIGST